MSRRARTVGRQSSRTSASTGGRNGDGGHRRLQQQLLHSAARTARSVLHILKPLHAREVALSL